MRGEGSADDMFMPEKTVFGQPLPGPGRGRDGSHHRGRKECGVEASSRHWCTTRKIVSRLDADALRPVSVAAAGRAVSSPFGVWPDGHAASTISVLVLLLFLFPDCNGRSWAKGRR